MPPFRNPFVRRPPPINGIGNVTDENTPPPKDKFVSSNERPGYSTSRANSAVSIKAPKEPDEFKMSVVNDSGVYLPPSPPEKRGFWQRTPTSTTTSSHRSMLSDNEPFSISRESFESYRRSFDISARSPVTHPEQSYGRQSLDARSPRNPRSALNGTTRFEPPAPRPVNEQEETFEDVGLNEEANKPKKRSLFSRFTESSENAASDDAARPGSSHRGFHLPGRRHGHSGQGAELGNMPKASKKDDTDGVIR